MRLCRDWFPTKPRTALGLSVTSMPVRTARLADARQIAEVHVSSWRAAYRGIVPDTLLDSLSVEAWTGLWQERLSRPSQAINLVSVFAKSVIGLITTGPAGDPDCDVLRTQEVYAIYLSSEYWSHGHGTELYLAAEDRMGQSGAVDAILWVLRDNVRARRFYEGQGFTLDRSRPERDHQGSLLWSRFVTERDFLNVN
jgi:ribosomal protein S18 acetylase RimI-like enzyme